VPKKNQDDAEKKAENPEFFRRTEEPERFLQRKMKKATLSRLTFSKNGL